MSFYSIDFKSHEKLYDHIWNTTKTCGRPKYAIFNLLKFK